MLGVGTDHGLKSGANRGSAGTDHSIAESGAYPLPLLDGQQDGDAVAKLCRMEIAGIGVRRQQMNAVQGFPHAGYVEDLLAVKE